MENLRDQIAMSVIGSIVQSSEMINDEYYKANNILENHCKLAYKIADEMLRVRNNLN